MNALDAVCEHDLVDQALSGVLPPGDGGQGGAEGGDLPVQPENLKAPSPQVPRLDKKRLAVPNGKAQLHRILRLKAVLIDLGVAALVLIIQLVQQRVGHKKHPFVFLICYHIKLRFKKQHEF